nr:hypothetical protein CFP56_52453 [Quercus suber]
MTSVTPMLPSAERESTPEVLASRTHRNPTSPFGAPMLRSASDPVARSTRNRHRSTCAVRLPRVRVGSALHCIAADCWAPTPRTSLPSCFPIPHRRMPLVVIYTSIFLKIAVSSHRLPVFSIDNDIEVISNLLTATVIITCGTVPSHDQDSGGLQPEICSPALLPAAPGSTMLQLTPMIQKRSMMPWLASRPTRPCLLSEVGNLSDDSSIAGAGPVSNGLPHHLGCRQTEKIYQPLRKHVQHCVLPIPLRPPTNRPPISGQTAICWLDVTFEGSIDMARCNASCLCRDTASIQMCRAR